MARVPESVVDLLEKPIVATLTTIAPDGIPENTAIWVLWDGEYAYISTVDGRRKPSNIRNNSNVALFVIDPENALKWVDLRGVASIEKDDDYQLLNKVTKLYTGVDEYYGGMVPAEDKGTEDRIIIKVKPLRVASQG